MNTNTPTDPRDMVIAIMCQYRADAIHQAAEFIGTTTNNIRNWLDGAMPEPINRNKIKAAYQAFIDGGQRKVQREPESNNALPRRGHLSHAQELFIDRIIEKEGSVPWAYAMTLNYEQAFLSAGHLEHLRNAGGGIGTRFWGTIGVSSRDPNLLEVKAMDILI